MSYQRVGDQKLDDSQNRVLLSKDEINTLGLLGYSYIESESYEAALVLFEALHYSAPFNLYACKSLAYLYLVFMRYQDALSLFSGLEDGFFDAEILKIQSIALIGLGQESDAKNKRSEYFQMRDIL